MGVYVRSYIIQFNSTRVARGTHARAQLLSSSFGRIIMSVALFFIYLFILFHSEYPEIAMMKRRRKNTTCCFQQYIVLLPRKSTLFRKPELTTTNYVYNLYYIVSSISHETRAKVYFFFSIKTVMNTVQCERAYVRRFQYFLIKNCSDFETHLFFGKCPPRMCSAGAVRCRRPPEQSARVHGTLRRR